ncbi:MAG: hypothetical protein KDK41_11505 [Leptospiraceae bacterium]|nr:hypothetical protein [Leptospiraceae bacterium]
MKKVWPFALSVIFNLLLMPKLTATEPGQKYDFFCKDGQHFRGAELVTETEDAYIIKLFYSDQEKKIFKSELIKPPQPLDTIPPRFVTTPKSNSTLNSLPTLLIEYSEEVLFADKIENYLLTLPARNSLAIREITRESATGYRLYFSGEAGNGAFAIELQNITDLSGNALVLNKIIFEFDKRSSRITYMPDQDSVINTLANIELTFEKEMQGIDNLQNYVLGGQGAQLLKLKKVEAMTGKTAVLFFDGDVSNGEIKLSLENITDITGNTPENSVLVLKGDTEGPRAEVFPPNGSSLTDFSTIEIQFNEKVSNSLDKSIYSVSEGAIGNIALSSVEPISENKVKLKLTRKPRPGNLTLKIRGLSDSLQNKSSEVHFSWQIESEGVSTETIARRAFWPGSNIYAAGSFLSVQGQMTSFFSSGFDLSLGFDTNYFLRRGPLKAANDHPLLPSLHVEANYMQLTGSQRTLSGFTFLLGPAWFIPFYPSPQARLGISLSAGYTLLNIKGLTFDGVVRTLIISPEFSYQILFLKKITGKIFIKENMILDPAASLYNLSMGIAIGYAF